MLLYLRNDVNKETNSHSHVIIVRYEDYEATDPYVSIVDVCLLQDAGIGGITERAQIRELGFYSVGELPPNVLQAREMWEHFLGDSTQRLRRYRLERKDVKNVRHSTHN